MLSPTERATLAKWNIISLYLNSNTKTKYIGFARTSYQSILTANMGAPSGTPIASDLRDFLLLDADFQKAITKKAHWIDVINYKIGGTYFILADIFARYIVDKDWFFISH